MQWRVNSLESLGGIREEGIPATSDVSPTQRSRWYRLAVEFTCLLTTPNSLARFFLVSRFIMLPIVLGPLIRIFYGSLVTPRQRLLSSSFFSYMRRIKFPLIPLTDPFLYANGCSHCEYRSTRKMSHHESLDFYFLFHTSFNPPTRFLLHSSLLLVFYCRDPSH